MTPQKVDLPDFEKSIIGNALFQLKTKADKDKIIEELHGTALSEEGLSVFQELADKKIKAFRLA